jgi:hypothetical protein
LGEVVKPLHPKTGRCHPAIVPLSLAARVYRDSGLVLPPKHEPASRDWGFRRVNTRRLNHRPMKQSKVGALPQTPPGAEPLDLNTYARFR